MSKAIQIYNAKDLIKADNGQNLIQYWKDVYENEEFYKDRIDEYLEKNLKDLMICIKGFKSILCQGFYLECILEKAEIHLTHCLVLNQIRNKRLKLENNPYFQEILENVKSNKKGKAVFDKIIKDFNDEK